MAKIAFGRFRCGTWCRVSIFFTFSALIPNYFKNRERVRKPLLSCCLFPSCTIWKPERDKWCLIIFLTWAVSEVVVIFFFDSDQNQQLLLLWADAFWPIPCSSSPALPSYWYVLSKHRWGEVWDTTLRYFLPSPSKKGPCANAWHRDHIRPLIICHFVVRKHTIICHHLK